MFDSQYWGAGSGSPFDLVYNPQFSWPARLSSLCWLSLWLSLCPPCFSPPAGIPGRAAYPAFALASPAFYSVLPQRLLGHQATSSKLSSSLGLCLTGALLMPHEIPQCPSSPGLLSAHHPPHTHTHTPPVVLCDRCRSVPTSCRASGSCCPVSLLEDLRLGCALLDPESQKYLARGC